MREDNTNPKHIAKLNSWLSEHESMLASTRRELNDANRKLNKQEAINQAQYEYERQRIIKDSKRYVETQAQLKAANKLHAANKLDAGPAKLQRRGVPIIQDNDEAQAKHDRHAVKLTIKQIRLLKIGLSFLVDDGTINHKELKELQTLLGI